MLESLFNKYRLMSRWLYYKQTPTQVFSCEYCQIFKNLTSINDCLWILLIQSGRNNRKNRDVSRDDNRSRIQNPVKHLRCSFLQKRLPVFNRWLFFWNASCYLFPGLWTCLDKTKQNPGVLSFISQKIRTAISVNLFLSSYYYLAERH